MKSTIRALNFALAITNSMCLVFCMQQNQQSTSVKTLPPLLASLKSYSSRYDCPAFERRVYKRKSNRNLISSTGAGGVPYINPPSPHGGEVHISQSPTSSHEIYQVKGHWIKTTSGGSITHSSYLIPGTDDASEKHKEVTHGNQTGPDHQGENPKQLLENGLDANQDEDGEENSQRSGDGDYEGDVILDILRRDGSVTQRPLNAPSDRNWITVHLINHWLTIKSKPHRVCWQTGAALTFAQR